MGTGIADTVDNGQAAENTGSGQQKVSEGNIMDLERAAQIGTVTAGTEYDEEFLIDNVLFFNDEGEYDAVEELHYHIYVPDSYDGSRPYALYITLPHHSGNAGGILQILEYGTWCRPGSGEAG